MAGPGWLATSIDGNHVHVVPLGDLVEHVEDDAAECICGPTVEPCERADGSFGWLLTHHSVDGREQTE